MNSSPDEGTLELALPRGTVRWEPQQRVSISTADGRAASPGDGIATDLANLLGSGALSPGAHRTVDAPLGTVHGNERGLGDGIDMTNWNVIVDDRLIVKVVGRLGDGDRAVRLSRALSHRVPDAVPLLHGTLELDTPAGRTVVATVHEFLADSVDGWTWAVNDAESCVATVQFSAWPRELGRMVAGVHQALVDSSRVAFPTASESTPAFDSAVIERAERTERSDAASVRLRARRRSVEAARASAPPPTAPHFAIHGDLHVGQVLRDRQGVLRLIDFDGDPLGGFDPDMAEAGVDVAHLLVSLDLVCAVVAKRRGDDPGIRAWLTQARKDLLAGYAEIDPRHAGVPLLDVDRLPALETEQLLRECRYADLFLPRWRYAADWAITHRFDPEPDLEDPPWTPPVSSTT